MRILLSTRDIVCWSSPSALVFLPDLRLSPIPWYGPCTGRVRIFNQTTLCGFGFYDNRLSGMPQVASPKGRGSREIPRFVKHSVVQGRAEDGVG